MLKEFRESGSIRSGACVEGVGDVRDGDERTDDDDDDELDEEDVVDETRSGRRVGLKRVWEVLRSY